MTDQVIYDRGYRAYDGPRTGTRGARVAVYKEGLRRILGLGRKARYKIFPWSLISIALVAAAVFIGIHWAIGDLAASFGQGVPGYAELFDFYSAISLLFIAFAGPQLLIPDRTKGVLSVYFSRPLTVEGYLMSKVGAFATIVAAFYIVPQLVLHVGLALIADEGIVPYLSENLEILWKVPVITIGFVALHGALIVGFAAYIGRTGIAAAAFLGLITAGGAVASEVAEASFEGARYFSLLALDQHPRIIRDALLGDTLEYSAEAAGFEVWVSVVIIAAIVAVALAVVVPRYRRLA